MTPLDRVRWGGTDRLTNIENALADVAGGALPAVSVSPIAHGAVGVTIKDDSANTFYEVENISADASHYAGAILLGGSNGQAGAGGRAWGIGIDVAAATPYRDLAIYKVGGIDGSGGGGGAYDFLYFCNRGSSPPSMLIGNSSFTPAAQVETIMTTDGSGNATDTSLANLKIHTALITGGTPQTQPAIIVSTWTSATDRFHVEADGSVNLYDAGGANNVNIGSASNKASFRTTSFNIGDSAFGSASHTVFVKTTSADADLAIQTTAGGSFQIQCLNGSGTVNFWSVNNSDLNIGTNGVTRLTVGKNANLTGPATDVTVVSYSGATGTGAFTITRFNYIQMKNPSGSATVTDAAVLQFDAAIGTHKAVDTGTTKTSPGTVTAWIKVNINGTIHYMPAYASKTT